MISGLIFLSVMLAFMLYFSIYRKTPLYNFVCFWLAVGVAATYGTVDNSYEWGGVVYVTVACMAIAGYNLVMIAKR